LIQIKTETKTKIRDRGANNLFKQTEKIGRETVITSGVQLPQGAKLPIYKGSPDGKVNIAQYAFWNEYGTKHMAARPFLRTTVLEKQALFEKQTMVTMRKLARGGSAFILLNKQAMSITQWIKTTIWKLKKPANRPATLRSKKKRKRGSNPLIDSKSLRDSITSTVHFDKGPNSRELRRVVNRLNKEIMGLTP
jgi:hypothetical protein